MPREDLVEPIFFSLEAQTAFIDLILRCDFGQNNTFHNDISSSSMLCEREILLKPSKPITLWISTAFNTAFNEVCACQVTNGAHFFCIGRLATTSWLRLSRAICVNRQFTGTFIQLVRLHD